MQKRFEAQERLNVRMFTTSQISSFVAKGHLPLEAWGTGERQFKTMNVKYGPYGVSNVKFPKGGVTLNTEFLMTQVHELMKSFPQLIYFGRGGTL